MHIAHYGNVIIPYEAVYTLVLLFKTLHIYSRSVIFHLMLFLTEIVDIISNEL